MKFCEVNKCKFWEVNTNELLPREHISLVDIFPNCVNECLQMNYSSTFVWMAAYNHVENTRRNSSFIHQDGFSFVVHAIEMILKLPRADESSQKYKFDGIIMCFVETCFNSMVSTNKLEDSSYIRQLIRNIRLKFLNLGLIN